MPTSSVPHDLETVHMQQQEGSYTPLPLTSSRCCQRHACRPDDRGCRSASLAGITLCMQRVSCSPTQAPVGEQQQQQQQQEGMPALAPASEAPEEPLPTEAAHPEAHRMGSRVSPGPRVLEGMWGISGARRLEQQGARGVCAHACVSADRRVRG